MDYNSEQFFRVLKKYYLMRKAQKDIAQSENVSTATISRMINRAIEMGYVTFSLKLPEVTMFELEEQIKEKFHLDYVSVVHVDVNDKDVISNDVANSVSNYLNHIVKDNDIIGVSWGNTLYKVAQKLKPKDVSNVITVGVNGGVSKSATTTNAEWIISQFAKNFNGEGYLLPVPSFVDNPKIAKTLQGDSRIQELFTLINSANILLFSIGNIREDSVLIKSGYFKPEEYQELRRQGYVGDICSRYLKKDGSHSDDDLYNRVIGISLEELKAKNNKICVIMEEEKAIGLYGALKGGYVNTLFIDELTAIKLMEIQ